MNKYLTPVLMAIILVLGILSFRTKEEKSGYAVSNYRIISASSIPELRRKVNEEIKGAPRAELIGGVAFANGTYLQAMAQPQ